jgi:hypothetical protein
LGREVEAMDNWVYFKRSRGEDPFGMPTEEKLLKYQYNLKGSRNSFNSKKSNILSACKMLHCPGYRNKMIMKLG